MYIVDDPMLLLITRFVQRDRDAALSDQEFMQQQVTAIQAYVAQFPNSERNWRAIEWIEKHARQYRKSWQRGYISRWMKNLRCPDCPLADGHPISHCDIHERWSNLLANYADDKITSREYVEETLTILREHKAQLKVTKS